MEKIKTESLDNCPFCGSDNVSLHYGNKTFGKCNNCGAEGSKYPKEYGRVAEHIDKQWAILAWNKRAKKK